MQELHEFSASKLEAAAPMMRARAFSAPDVRLMVGFLAGLPPLQPLLEGIRLGLPTLQLLRMTPRTNRQV